MMKEHVSIPVLTDKVSVLKLVNVLLFLFFSRNSGLSSTVLMFFQYSQNTMTQCHLQ